MQGFQLVEQQVAAKKSQIILGMDEGWSELSDDEIMRRIADARPYIVGVKPNGAFWPDEKLSRICKRIRKEMPDLVIIYDAKRNDIGNTQKAWAQKDQENFNPHIVTLNTYMGYKDVVSPFAERGIDAFVLAATSNDGTELQNMYSGGLTIYQQNYLLGRRYDPNNIGYVIGSTKGGAMIDIRAVELEHRLNQAWGLAPGLGGSGQKGEPDAIVPFAGDYTLYPMSRQFAVENPGNEARVWRDKINDTEARGYTIKSLSQIFIEEMIKEGIFKIASGYDDWFPLSAGGTSPIYWDVRNVQWFPDLRRQAAYLMAKTIRESGVKYDFIVPVLMGALGLGFPVADMLDARILTVRDKLNRPGQQEFVGRPVPGSVGLMVEDVFTTLKSTEETIEKVRNLREKKNPDDEGVPLNLMIRTAAALMNREQAVPEKLNQFANNEIKLLNTFVQSDVIEKVLGNDPRRAMVMKYLEDEKQKPRAA